ncbi:MAG: C-terminal binding protein [Rhodospirillaceae bacterium]|jgi:D-3-phosphoglycerate dehydrogenase|nr:C-terminal binding protein [Rhodospirillaceae bacterium]MBT3887372.1 C-terminal binding protein [Rhodospirillaceae bacterium]MBT4116959.1 C-terminal binding protein [Rhodospirillaceae bacterium]MBT4674142.1 C-terminal binding protein [Rhodospirillaceae bacterium]MBT4749619.1 C-terminal binding protein [Rhodospirillaceae bacterium]
MSSTLIAVADTVFPSLDPALEALAAVEPELKIAKDASVDNILAVAADAEALLVTYGQINAEVIAGLNNCKVIGRFGIGIDNIDIAAATKKGITVTYAPVYCLDEVSDHAMALLLSLARKVTFGANLVSGGRWEMPAVVPIHRLKGRTLGLVGLGNIPQALVPKAQAFGIKVIAADPYCPDDVFQRMGVEKVDLDEMLARSDYVSVHAPLTPETEKMFNADAFKQMKPNAFLINTARGPLVDIDDLAAALDAGEIAGAALDVLPSEPPGADNPVVGRADVILTPHTGFYSEDALLDLQTTVASDVARVLTGEEPKYPVKPR